MLFNPGLFITLCLNVGLLKCSLITVFNCSNWKVAAAGSYLVQAPASLKWKWAKLWQVFQQPFIWHRIWHHAKLLGLLTLKWEKIKVMNDASSVGMLLSVWHTEETHLAASMLNSCLQINLLKCEMIWFFFISWNKFCGRTFIVFLKTRNICFYLLHGSFCTD